MPINRVFLSSTVLSGLAGLAAGVVPATAAEIGVGKAPPAALAWPAVDGINGKIEPLGGSLASRAIYGSKGSISVPLGGQYGAQFDGALGGFDSRFFGSAAGHLFWRDPARALVGAYVNHTHWDVFGGVGVTQVAAEGEYYWNRWTLQGIAGVEFGDSATQSASVTTVVAAGINNPGLITTTTFVDTFDVKTRFFDKINLAYYINEDWKAFIGHRYLGGKHALALGTEYAFPISRGVLASGFIEGRVGEGDFHGVWGGMKFYFGQKDKPLIARHRQDDPLNWAPDTLFSIVNSLGRNIFQSSVVIPPLGD